MMTLKSATLFSAIAVVTCFVAIALLDGCQLKHPVPCDPSQQWPDPCVEGIVETTAKDAAAER